MTAVQSSNLLFLARWETEAERGKRLNGEEGEEGEEGFTVIGKKENPPAHKIPYRCKPKNWSAGDRAYPCMCRGGIVVWEAFKFYHGGRLLVVLI